MDSCDLIQVDLFVLLAKFNAFVMQMSKLIFRWWKISSEPLLSSILTWKRNGWMSPSKSSFISLGVYLITCFSSHYTITLNSETATRVSGFFISASLARLCLAEVVLGFLYNFHQCTGVGMFPGVQGSFVILQIMH